MADAGAWNQGWALGSQRAQEGRAHKQALSDMELEGKINDLIEQKKGLQAKIPAYLDPSGKPKAGVDGQPIPEYQQLVSSLQQNARELKEVYHPDANPTAIARFGHLLTDHLGITHPSQRQGKAAAKSAQDAQAAQQSAQEAVSSAPLSLEQQKTNEYTAQVNAQVAMIEKSGMSDDDKTRAKQAIFKIYARPNNVWLDLPDGTTILGDKNDPDSIPPGAKPHLNPTAGSTDLGQYNQGITNGTIPAGTSFEAWKAGQKPSTSKLGINVESYRKLHNIPAGQPLTPDQLNFIEQQIALSSAAPSTNITTSVKQDVNGMWVPVTEENRHVPGFGVILSDPLKGGQSAAGDAVQQPAANGASQSAVHKATPSGTTHPASASKPTANGSSTTKVGAPLFQGRTPAIAKAQNDVVDATKLDSIASQVEKKPNDAFNQKRLAVALERSSAGRFTVQALDYIKQIGWGASIDEWAAKPTTGALPPQLVRQLVDGAHENLKAAKDSLQAAIQGTGAAAPNTDSDPDIDAILQGLKNTKPKAP